MKTKMPGLARCVFGLFSIFSLYPSISQATEIQHCSNTSVGIYSFWHINLKAAIDKPVALVWVGLHQYNDSEDLKNARRPSSLIFSKTGEERLGFGSLYRLTVIRENKSFKRPTGKIWSLVFAGTEPNNPELEKWIYNGEIKGTKYTNVLLTCAYEKSSKPIKEEKITEHDLMLLSKTYWWGNIHIYWSKYDKSNKSDKFYKAGSIEVPTYVTGKMTHVRRPYPEECTVDGVSGLKCLENQKDKPEKPLIVSSPPDRLDGTEMVVKPDSDQKKD